MPEAAQVLDLPRGLGPGCLVLVVGPSGAGKDTLIGYAQERLQGDPKFVFPRRVITRAASPALEDHDSVSEAEFAVMLADGCFALHWTAHGLHYGVPRTIDDCIARSAVAVVNISRRVIPAARTRYARVTTVEVTAPPSILAERLGQRGREDLVGIEHRLSRMGDDVGEGVRIVNDGPVVQAGEHFMAVLATCAASGLETFRALTPPGAEP